MIVTIKVLTIKAPVGAEEIATNEVVVARGYLPSGQEVVTSGHPVPRAEYKSAIRVVVEWIFKHRPQWSIEIDDARMGHTTEVSP